MCLSTWCSSFVKLVLLPDRTDLIALGSGWRMRSQQETLMDKNDRIYGERNEQLGYFGKKGGEGAIMFDCRGTQARRVVNTKIFRFLDFLVFLMSDISWHTEQCCFGNFIEWN
jgi:hypothetical protein